MKKLIVFLFFVSTFVLAQDTPKKGPRPSENRKREEETPQRPQPPVIQVTPSSVQGRLLHQAGLRPIEQRFGARARGNIEDALYLVTIGQADLRNIPIIDLGNRVLTEQDINSVVNSVEHRLQDINALIYVGITGQGSERRAREHSATASERPHRRLYNAVLQSPEGALMHTLLMGVNAEQRPNLEARLIRALGGTGPRGLNGNAGNLGQEERGRLGQVGVTPNTRTPGANEGRQALYLDGENLIPLSPAQLPENWQNILYLITPPGIDVGAPIIDLQGEFLNEHQIAIVIARLEQHFQSAGYERYVGQATAGEHGERTAMTRAHEHARASFDAPYRRLPLAITRVNRETERPVQMHALIAGVHPDQIDSIEHLLIIALGGTGPLGWNSNPGSQPRNRLIEPVARNLFEQVPAAPAAAAVAAPAPAFGWIERMIAIAVNLGIPLVNMLKDPKSRILQGG